MRLYAFQGIHYDLSDTEGADTESAGHMAAPPYDQIDDEKRDRLHRLSPHHFSHLTVPVAENGMDCYENAARLHERWLAEGVLHREPEPDLYPYAIVFPDGRRRLGICGLVGIEPPDSPAIRPHERTLAKPLADRLALLETMHVDLEPILLVSEDDGRLDALLEEDMESAPVLVEHVDDDGYRHRLYRIETPSRFELYRQALAAGPGAVADGHHRYQVARAFAHQAGAREGTAPACKLAVVTSIHSPALAIDPIHRALTHEPDPELLDHLAAERRRWDVEGASGTDFARAVAEAPEPSLGVWLADGRREIWRLDPSQAPEHVGKGARNLSVVLLHEVVLARLGFDADRWTDGTVLYRSDPEALGRMMSRREVGVAFFLPPMAPVAFGSALTDGDLLPPKSTRFLPKVVSGLVWADHGSKLG